MKWWFSIAVLNLQRVIHPRSSPCSPIPNYTRISNLQFCSCYLNWKYHLAYTFPLIDIYICIISIFIYLYIYWYFPYPYHLGMFLQRETWEPVRPWICWRGSARPDATGAIENSVDFTAVFLEKVEKQSKMVILLCFFQIFYDIWCWRALWL